jgi:hypothetical protein
MATKIATISPNTYAAYGGPETGGFSLTQAPDLGVDDQTRQFMFGDATTPAHPLIDLYGAGVGEIPAAPTSVPVVPRGPKKIATLEMAASTIAPKGGEPFQPTTAQDQAIELYRLLNQQGPEPPGIPPTALGNYTLSTAQGIANNILAAPSVAGDILSYPGRQLKSSIEGKGLANLSVFPKPTVEGIAAKLRAATGETTEAEARANIQEAEARRQEKFPWSTYLGDVSGDIATLAMGRGPFVEGLRAKEVDLGRKIAHGKTMYESWPFLNKLERAKVLNQSPGYNLFKRGLGRAGEAGVEGATLGLLHGGDPVESAFFSAGAQGMMSAATDVFTRKFFKMPSRVATFAVNGGILTGVLYAADVALPGQAKDYEAQKTAAQKMLWGYGLGGLTALMSTRARSGFVSATAPHIADALGSIPRNAMQSILTRYLGSAPAERKTMKAKIEAMYSGLDKYTLPQLRELSDAFASGNADRFFTTLKRIGPPP